MLTRRTFCLLAGSAALAVGCDAGSPSPAPSRDDGVVVASFDFPESTLLAELYAQALEAVGVPVRLESGLGPRELVRPALQQGLVNVVPEYLGSAVSAFSGHPSPTSPAAALQALRGALRPLGLDALTAARAEDQDVLTVTPSTAARRRLATVSDLARTGPVRFTAPPECADRALCLQGLRRVYGLRVSSFLPLATSEQRVEALEEGISDAAWLLGTDPAVAEGDVVALRDDQHLQPPEQVVPVVSRRALERFGPRLRDTLDAVSRRLTTAALRTMLWRVTVAGRAPSAEAKGWLRRNGLR